jgi:uroporphyrinogen-III synthase
MKLAGLLEQRGQEATVEPLMRLSFEDCDPIDLEGVGTLVATSSNGLRALTASGALSEARRVPIFVVGQGTAREARRLGFEQILVGPGSAADLVPAIAATVEASAGLILHLAGDTVAFDLKGELEQLGFRIAQPTVYRMRPSEALSTSTIDELNDGKIDGVILMSPRTATIYVRLVMRHRLTAMVRDLVHFCLSRGVASRLVPLGDVRVVLPERTTLQELLAEIELTAAQWDE